MTLPRSASVMDEIFASPEEDGRGRLLKIIQEFLVSEASKHSAKEKGNFRTSDACICLTTSRICEDQVETCRGEHGRISRKY